MVADRDAVHIPGQVAVAQGVAFQAEGSVAVEPVGLELPAASVQPDLMIGDARPG